MPPPPNPDFTGFTVAELLATYGAILDELRRREIVRGNNNPLSDYAELLFCEAFGWKREKNAAAGHDATDAAGVKYQIKGRRLTKFSTSRQMSAIRSIDAKPFDHLAGLLVDDRFQILRAAIIPFDVVVKASTYVRHTHAHRFLLRDNVWDAPGVRDVTDELRAVAAVF
jgi:hypothetical protein